MKKVKTKHMKIERLSLFFFGFCAFGQIVLYKS